MTRNESVAEKSMVWRWCKGAVSEDAQVVDEPHVEHAVRFVDDQDLDVAERDRALLLVVQQPPRSSDEQIRDRLDGVALEAIVHAAEDGQGRQARVAPQDFGVCPNLGDELAGRRHHEGPGPAGTGRSGVSAGGAKRS